MFLRFVFLNLLHKSFFQTLFPMTILDKKRKMGHLHTKFRKMTFYTKCFGNEIFYI